MISPTDQPQAAAARRSTDPPTLWFSLALGSVLIHLVLFIIIAVMETRTAKVQLDPEPIAVEFVDPNAATLPTRSTAPSRAIAVRPGAPSSTPPSNFQAQPAAPRSQPPAFNQPVEQPFVPQPIRRNRALRRTQPQFDPSRNVAPQRPSPPINPTPFQPNQPSQPSNPTNPAQGQPLPTTSPSQGGVPGSTPNPTRSTVPLPVVSQPPVEGNKITQSIQGESVAVTLSNPRQPSVDVQTQPAQPLGVQKTVSLRYPSSLARQTIHLEATLVIGNNGLVVDFSNPTLLSSGSAIDPETLRDLVNQIFVLSKWQFEPAHDNSNGKRLTPPQSNLIIRAEVQLP